MDRRQVPDNSRSEWLSHGLAHQLPRGTLRAASGGMHSTTTDGPTTVLVIDDEAGVRESLRTILSGECTVYTATTGTEALGLIETTPIDVVTLDLRMPGIGGIGLLERIKAHDQDIEVLIITGYSSFDSAIDGIRLRAFDYVSKPFDIEHVRGLVRSAAARGRSVRRLRQARQDFVANLNQTFGTSLNRILGCTQTLRAGASHNLSEEQRRLLDQISTNSSDLLKQIEDFRFPSDLEGVCR
jgi:YesN/AraC family two-component response regulator